MLDLQQKAQTATLPQTAEELYSRLESLYGRVIKVVNNSRGSYAVCRESTSVGRIEALNFTRSMDRKNKEFSFSITVHLSGVAEGRDVDFRHSNVWSLQEDSGEWTLVHAGILRNETFFAEYGVGDDISVKELTA